jgi:hypothetical protein
VEAPGKTEDQGLCVLLNQSERQVAFSEINMRIQAIFAGTLSPEQFSGRRHWASRVERVLRSVASALSVEGSFTRTHANKFNRSSPLLASGLLGLVKIISEQ